MVAPQTPTNAVPHHVVTTSSMVDQRTLVLKHGDTFAVFDHYGRIKPGGLGEEGLYHEGTRFLSRLVLKIEQHSPIFLGSSVPGGNGQLAVVLTNPDLLDAGTMRLPFGTLHVVIRTLVWRGVCYQRIRVKNHGLHAIKTWLSLRFAADYADIFEVRGAWRSRRGQELEARVSPDRAVLGYRGLDHVVRQTSLHFAPQPSRLSKTTAHFDLSLGPQQECEFNFDVSCESGAVAPRVLSFDDARLECQTGVQRYSAWSCHVGTSNGQINEWIDRTVADLQMMTTELPTGPYPYAGVPWFSTPFGRDGIITALECLWLRPNLARGVLCYLASTQAAEAIPGRDAEPGKIVHETRTGEMAALGEVPFGRYYGSVDATPLFVLLAGAYYERTGDRAFLESLWPHVEAALNWLDRYGDRDGDGFVDYHRQSDNGLIHQGWKDSEDSIFHADGSLARGPIALCEVQGYVFAAKRTAAAMASALGHTEFSVQLAQQAETLRRKFEAAFWCEDLSTYALALDGEGRPCCVRASNAGHCLFTGIAAADRAQRVARTLMSPDCYSGWGVRTVAVTEPRYNPMAYHNGSVWPHDNAIIAQGLARYGFDDMALQILSGLFEAGTYFDLHRMPELFCGFAQNPGEGPVLYPVACAPQAWSAASVFLLLQACLGVEVSALDRQIYFRRPQLPASLGELRIHNLEVAGATVDLLLSRQGPCVGVNVIRREGNVRVLVVQ